MIHQPKKLTILIFLSLAIFTLAASIGPTKKFKNLQVLPQDISESKLDSIMDSYSRALKVSCDFCHTAPKKNTFSITPVKDSFDYSTDNEMKENARKMIRMTIDINKNNFYFDKTKRAEYLNVVSCNTCHRGNPYPANE